MPQLYVTRDDEATLASAEGEWDNLLAQMIDHAPYWILASGGAGMTCHPNFVIDNY